MITLTEEQQGIVNDSVSRFIKRMDMNVFTVFDLETNGLNPGIDDVLSISAQKCRILPDKTVHVLEYFDRYYYCSKPYNPKATAVNGLVDDAAIKVKRGKEDSSYPRYAFDDVASFKKFIKGCHNFVGHNVIGFDMGWYEESIIFDNIFDTMLETKWTPANTSGRGPRLGNIVSFLEIPVDNESLHESSYDVEMTTKVFEKLLLMSTVRMKKLKEVTYVEW